MATHHNQLEKKSQIQENQRQNRPLDRKYPNFSPVAGKNTLFVAISVPNQPFSVKIEPEGREFFWR